MSGGPANYNPDALLFDFDGVLGDTEHAHHSSWNEVLEPFGIQFTWDEYVKECVGVADMIVAERLKLPNPVYVVDRKKEVFRATLERNPPFHPETIELIRELGRKYRMAVVSSSFRMEIEAPLERAGLLPYFEAVICGDHVKHFKPAPDAYLLAVERLGVSNPLVIEDSSAGVAAGKAAGLEVLQVSGPAQMPGELRAHLSKQQSLARL